MNHLSTQRWKKVAISGEITVGALALTARLVLKPIFNLIQAMRNFTEA